MDTLPNDPEDKHILCGDFNIKFWLIVQNSQNWSICRKELTSLPLKTLNQHAKPQARNPNWMRFFSNTLSSFHTTDSGISDQRTVTLTFEQSLKKSSNEHEKFTRKWAKLENRKNGGDLNNILLDKLKKLPATVVNGPLIRLLKNCMKF